MTALSGNNAIFLTQGNMEFSKAVRAYKNDIIGDNFETQDIALKFQKLVYIQALTDILCMFNRLLNSIT
jgi:hypothetical protein